MKNIIKTNVIRVMNMSLPDKSREVERKLGGMLGINLVKANDRRGRVRISYNLKFISYSNIEKMLAEMGYPPARGLFGNLKRGFINFTEKNEIQGRRPQEKRASLTAHRFH